MGDRASARRFMERLRVHARANVVGYVALFVALGGTGAYAADKITSKDLARNAVAAKHLKKGAVKRAKIAGRAVDARRLADGSVLTTKLADGAVDAGKIADASVLTSKLADSSVGPGKLADASVLTQKIADGAVTADKLADGAAGFTDYEYVERTHNVSPGDTSIVTSASCPPGKKLLGGGFAIQDSKFYVTFANPQENDVYGLTARVLPGQTITSSSQAFAKAICARVTGAP